MHIDEKYLDHAVEVASSYYPQTVLLGGLPRVAGKDEAQTAEILTYLAADPFKGQAARDTIRGILEKLLDDVTLPASPSTAGRDVVYLAGPKGSKDLLVAAAKEGKAPEIKAFLDRPDMFNGDFSRFKKLFKESQTLFPDKTKEEPYGKWRPVVSGVDNAMMKLCADHGISQIVDNCMAPVSRVHYDIAIQKYRALVANAQDQGTKARTHLFAVALTPAQAVEEAAKIGVTRAEAEQDAKNFATFFPKLTEEFNNITLYDREMHVIYQQREGKPINIDPPAMAAWKRTAGEPEQSVTPKSDIAR